MIDVKGLTKYYGPIAAIKDVTFHVEQGEIVGFLGPNGAGKTTTMRILTGFSSASSGTAAVAGFDIRENPIEVKRRVGYMPEHAPLYDEMLVSAFLRYVAEVKGVPRRERKREVGRVMERCGLEHMAKRVIRNLSKGYRQRVGLAQALIANPPVLILDEPTIGLDPKQIVDIRAMIKAFAKEHTVLLSTHILPEVQMVCERVLIINEGRLVAQDTLASLAGDTANICIEVGVEGPREAVVATLKRVPGVQRVTVPGDDRYLVEAARVPHARAEIARALFEAGYGLYGLAEHTRTLEEVFLEAITSEEGLI